MNEKIKQSITNLIEIRKHLWTTFLLLAAGSIGLLFKLESLFEVLLFISGVIITVIVFILIVDSNKTINDYIENIME